MAAAQYTAAASAGQPWQLVDALTSADTALALEPRLAQALFNRALILERLGLREQAYDAWQRYLDVDPGTAWAVEARARSTHMELRAPFRDEVERSYDEIATNASAAAEFVRRFPQDSRVWAETEFLARWAEAERARDLAGATRHLSVARAIGAALIANGGDPMVARAAAAVDRAAEAQRGELVSGHLAFRAGQRAFKNRQPAEAERLLTSASVHFRRGGSPVEILARYFAANTAYDQGRIAEAKARLEELLSSMGSEFRAARAQVQWQLGLCHAAESRWGDAIARFDSSLREFEALGESQYAATIRELLAEVNDVIGDPSSAWRLRTAALAELGRSTNLKLAAILGFLGHMAVVRRDWPAAASFLNLEIEASRKLGDDKLHADALLRRSLLLHQRGDDRSAREQIAEAENAINRLSDPRVRMQLENRRDWIAASVASAPLDRIALLSRAIGVATTSDRRMLLPTLLLERARAHRANGRPGLASADLDAAIFELESNRQSLPREEQRWGVFHAAESLFEEAVHLSLREGHVESALRYADRGRARTLLDVLPARAEVDVAAIPDDTAILEYVTYENRIVIFVARRSGVNAVAVGIARDELDEEVHRYQTALAVDDRAAAERGARALYRFLVEPAKRWLTDDQRLVLVTDSIVSNISFAALRGTDGRTFIEDHAVEYAPSATFYLHRLERPDNRSRDRLLLVASPAGGSRELLPEVKRETESITPLYREVTLLNQEGATAERFIREAMDTPMIHFAGHAIASAWEASDTALIFSDGRGGESRLDVGRITSLRLKGFPIVVLAACSTARGRVSPFEGTQSVARAFLAAGARSVIATSWPIDDAEAATFFPRLHRHLARGDSAADALRAAQIEAIQKSASPSLWAALQVIGN